MRRTVSWRHRSGEIPSGTRRSCDAEPCVDEIALPVHVSKRSFTCPVPGGSLSAGPIVSVPALGDATREPALLPVRRLARLSFLPSLVPSFVDPECEWRVYDFFPSPPRTFSQLSLGSLRETLRDAAASCCGLAAAWARAVVDSVGAARISCLEKRDHHDHVSKNQLCVRKKNARTIVADDWAPRWRDGQRRER